VPQQMQMGVPMAASAGFGGIHIVCLLQEVKRQLKRIHI
jgi:hypothetical protein